MSKKHKNKRKNKKNGKVEIRYVHAAPASNGNLFSGIGHLLPENASEQFLVGLAIGGTVAYVLSDEVLRTKLIRGTITLYDQVVGGIAELREQVADIQAETRAPQDVPQDHDPQDAET